MSFPYEPVKGRYVAISYCEQCDQLIIDLFLMSYLYNLQTWGDVDWANVPKKMNPYGSTRICKACDELIERRRKEKVREEEQARYIRNCVVCGDPFIRYSWRNTTTIEYIYVYQMTCTKKKCRDTARDVFNTRNWKGISVKQLRYKAQTAIYDGHWLEANIYYLLCNLLFTVRSIYGHL